MICGEGHVVRYVVKWNEEDNDVDEGKNTCPEWWSSGMVQNMCWQEKNTAGKACWLGMWKDP